MSGRLVALTLSAGLAWASSFAATSDDDARAQARNRFMLEQLRQYQLAHQAKSGAFVVKELDSRGLPIQPTPKTPGLSASLMRVPAAKTADSQFESLVKRTYRQLLAGPSGCCHCTTASTCNDSLFCNGSEICQSGICAPGGLPCVDGNPCTTDVCTETTDTCSHPAVPPPAPVASLSVARSGLPAVTTIAWSSVPGATAYNVYRGAASTLGDLACFAPGVVGTSSTDLQTPAHAFFYLVTATACGESGLGSGQPGSRPPPPGCP